MYRLRELSALTLLFTFLTAVRAQDTSPNKVIVGAYVNDTQSLNLREHSYSMDVYVWFRWRDPSFNPTETVEIVNPNELWGHVRNVQYEQPLLLPSGELYQVLRVQGRFSHKFFFNNFPYDRQKLVVEFEDSVNEVNRMVYVADKNPISINPRLVLPGFRVGIPNLAIESFAYPTDFGDTRRTEPNAYSRVRIEIPIRRPIWTSTLKMLLPVLCVVFGASLMLRFKVTYIDARLGVGITSLLTVVAIQLAANETMPNVDYLVLMDKIHLAAYGYVLAGLGIVLVTAQRLENNDLEAAQRFQWKGYLISSLLFVAVISTLIAYAVVRG
ncbi:MAG: hypothetical protein IT423_23485 [Pirellulaceae bacterium]|nr:hypothetical protein [Pirellulaceae bacterium]